MRAARVASPHARHGRNICASSLLLLSEEGPQEGLDEDAKRLACPDMKAIMEINQKLSKERAEQILAPFHGTGEIRRVLA